MKIEEQFTQATQSKDDTRSWVPSKLPPRGGSSYYLYNKTSRVSRDALNTFHRIHVYYIGTFYSVCGGSSLSAMNKQDP
jgi:hypothetical protein